MNKSLLLLLAILFTLMPVFPVSSSATPAPIPLDNLDTWLEEQFPRTGAPAMAVAVVDKDSLVYSRVFGDADTDATFFIASLSKSITATAVLMLVQDGLIDLDTPIQQYIPDFKVSDPQHSAAITVRQLLNQTSGLSDTGYQAAPEAFTSLEAMLADLVSAQPASPPGSAFHYFNPNYQTLGLLVETVSGIPFESFVQERIFDPLDMDTAGFAADSLTLRGYNQAFGQPVFLYDTMQPPAPSGGAVASADDVARLVQLYLADGADLLDPGLAALALTPSGVDSEPGAPAGYGMGWYTAEHDGIRYLTHGGDIDSFHADMALLPESGLGVVILYNTNNLFANFSVFPATINGAVKILSGGEEPGGGITMKAFGIVMLAWLLWSLYSGIRKLMSAGAWAGRAQRFGTLRTGAALVSSLIPAFILVFLPQIVLLISGRTAPLKLLFSYLPDVLFILAAASVLGVAQFILRVLALRAVKQSP